MNSIAAGAGLGIDRLLGEPPSRWHPVAWFGTAMSALEGSIHADRRGRGLGYTLCGLTLASAPALVVRRLLGPWVATVVAVGVASAGAMLESEAHGVADRLIADDLSGAREQVARIVGRSTSQLDATDVARAVVETIAENTVDAVTASIFWASVAGAPGATAHRAINTMDAMVGHRTPRHERFGWASARLDDAANWIPARLTALAVMIVTPHRALEIARTIHRDAGRHPSPNGGVVEAAFAAALGVRLGGSNVYGGVVEDRGDLGTGRPVEPADVRRATLLARRATFVFAAGCIVVGSTLARSSGTLRKVVANGSGTCRLTT